MKKKATLFSLLLGVMNSCSNEVFINEHANVNYEKRISVMAEDLAPVKGTRTAYTEMGEGRGYSFTWTEGDELGIFPANGRQTSFPISEGKGTNTALFNGGDWSLKPNASYAAYYPLHHIFDLDKTAIPVSYVGQTQDGNGDTRHLATYDFMASAFTLVDAKGNVSLELKHLGSLVQFNLAVPKIESFSKVVISSDNAEFITEGTYDLTSSCPSISPTATSKSFTINLVNTKTNADNQVLKINMMLAPVDFSNSTFTIKLIGSLDKYIYELDGKDLKKGSAYTDNGIVDDVSNIPYITFKAENLQSLTMSQAVNSLEYSVSGDEWATLGTKTVTFGGEKGYLRLRGKNQFGTATDDANCSQIKFATDTKVRCSGDIRTLIDYENFNTVSTSEARFCNLFHYCKQLISAPRLPAIDLASSCYSNMFSYCTSLTNAPELPAVSLSKDCFHNMFLFCTSLVDAPELPSKTLVDGCYSGMFHGCSSIETAPDLPATSLAKKCYELMFYGCHSLTTAPNLPATELAQQCYGQMFEGCSSLETLPELPASSLAEQCYRCMFKGCTSLITAPKLRATSLAKQCYECMFEDCTALGSAPVLPATTLAYYCYDAMFEGCTSLTTAPELPATTLAEGCYAGMFSGCTSLVTAPDLLATSLVKSCYYQMFYRCVALNYIKMMATSISAENCLYEWVYLVAKNGKFVKNAAATWNNRNYSSVPAYWIIEIAIE